MISRPEFRELDRNGTAYSSFEEENDQFFQERLLMRLRQLWGHRRFLVRCLLVGLIVSTLIAFLIPKLYESTAQLMPPDTQSSSNLALMAGLAGNNGGLGMLAGDLLGVKSTGALFVGVLRSRTVEDRIVDRFDLKKVYWTSLREDARLKLAARTGISEDRKSGIITITVTDGDPKRAAAMASAYVEELNILIAQVSTSSARRERIFLEDRLQTVKQDLESAEKDFGQFSSSKGAIDISAQGKAMVEAAATLEGQLIAAQSELEGLKQIYSDQNVRVRSTQARANELRQQLDKLGGKPGGGPESENASTSSVTYPTLRQLPILGIPYADKFRRMKVEEALFETLTKQYEFAKVQEAKEVPSVKELDVPVVPERKSFPPRLQIMTWGALAAMFAGMVWVLATARWQEINPQHPGKVLALEVFHTVAARLPMTSRNGHGTESPDVVNDRPEQDEPRAKDASAGA